MALTPEERASLAMMVTVGPGTRSPFEGENVGPHDYNPFCSCPACRKSRSWELFVNWDQRQRESQYRESINEEAM